MAGSRPQGRVIPTAVTEIPRLEQGCTDSISSGAFSVLDASKHVSFKYCQSLYRRLAMEFPEDLPSQFGCLVCPIPLVHRILLLSHLTYIITLWLFQVDT